MAWSRQWGYNTERGWTCKAKSPGATARGRDVLRPARARKEGAEEKWEKGRFGGCQAGGGMVWSPLFFT